MKEQGRGNREQGTGRANARPASAGPTLSAEEALAKVTPARRAAFEILTLVGQNKGHSDELLHSSLTDGLSGEDRNLATALVMGVLRWQIALDARIKTLLQRPDQRLAEPVALALRMGAFQLLHMNRIPAHAAISESVELCRAAGEPHATGMVNAILRKVAATQKPSARIGAKKIWESTAAFAERLGHPKWLVERWVAAYGREAALSICEAGQMEHPAGVMFSQVGGDIPLMDDGSRLVAELAAAAVPGAKLVWDCCAAPGGKALILALRQPEAQIFATDVSTKRTAQMQSRMKRSSVAGNVKCFVLDAAVPVLKNDEKFDLILCDVPCSGTGTLAENPEIRHRLKPEELLRQSDRQKLILKGALSRLAEGGRLVYSTCSLEPEENEQVVEAALAGSAFRRVPVDGLVESFRDSGMLIAESGTLMRNGALRTLPGVHGCDGFYAVVVERAGSV